ncbi:MAG: zinc metallopeptidase [Lachnospiraceae bacterium]|nr:zinc metallopeptidase [Lachnospiraceae bacterium]
MYLGGYGTGLYLMWDPTYVLILIGVALSLIASAGVRRTFSRYSTVRSASGITGEETARRILSYAGITDVKIQHVSGQLNDHYNPKTKVVNLSDAVYGNNSVSAVAVAAHECGHVIQHAKGYAPLSIRTALVPAANFGSGASWFIILAGILFSIPPLITMGIVLFSLAVLFQLVTLPVEFNASRRALGILQETGILGNEEGRSARKVLRAAALTYVAAAAASILQLLRLIILFGRNRNN